MMDIVKDKKILLMILVILFAGFLLRFINLTNLPVFVDEAIYVRWSQVMRAEPSLRFLPLSDGKQPLFMWITIPFLKIFSDPLAAGRLVSVLSGLGTIVGVFVLSYLVFGHKKSAVIASLMYAFSPFSVFFDRMALVDSLLSFFGIFTVIFAILTYKTQRLDLSMITGFFLGGALLTKSPALFFVILLPLLIFLSRNLKDKWNTKTILKLIFFTLVIYALGYGIYNILRLGPNFHLIASRNQDYVYPLVHIFQSPMDPLISHLKDVGNWLVRLLPFPWILLLPFVFISLNKQRALSLLVLSTFFLFPIFAQSAWAKAFTARYILFTIPFLVVILSSVFELKFKKLNMLPGALLIVGILFSLVQNYNFIRYPQNAWLPGGERSGYLEDWTAGYGISEVASYIRNEYVTNPSQQIVVGTEGYFGTLPDGLQIYLNDLREVVVVGVGLGINRVPDALSKSKASGNKTYLVVNSTRFDGDPEKLGFIKIASYPKAIKLNGNQEELLFLEVK